MSTDAEALDRIASGYDPSKPDFDFDYWFVRLSGEMVIERLAGTRVLELGCSTGLMTEMLLGEGVAVTCVEGSPANIATASARLEPEALARCRFVLGLWEDHHPDGLYSDVVACRALEHLADAAPVLRMAARALRPDGRLHVTVPNARSLHRRVAVEMGMLGDVHDLNERDLRVGHHRVYDRETLVADLERAGFGVDETAGVMLKPLANGQMGFFDEAMVRAFHAVGQELPDWCGEVYALASPGGGA